MSLYQCGYTLAYSWIGGIFVLGRAPPNDYYRLLLIYWTVSISLVEKISKRLFMFTIKYPQR